MKKKIKEVYGQPAGNPLRKIKAPALAYQPVRPRRFRPRIGLIGCGGITQHHLGAYRKMGYDVVALADIDPTKAEKRRQEYFPKAKLFVSYHDLLADPEINVVDIATHPHVRAKQIQDALLAGKHVLSQKPFVLDRATGLKLVALARRKKLRLAVNQNGRWAPYFSYTRAAVEAGLLGDLHTVDLRMNWDHTWCQGTAFEKVHHLVLYDFAIHWFDIVACLFGRRKARKVWATAVEAPGQTMKPPLLAHAAIEFDGGLATLSFSAHSKFGNAESATVVGSSGTIQCDGPLCASHDLRLFTAAGVSRPALQGNWFPDGFAGSMSELLCAIEENREPSNSAESNLRSLALCFAALKSADEGRAITLKS
jgi:predicted dehydrogenase